LAEIKTFGEVRTEEATNTLPASRIITQKLNVIANGPGDRTFDSTARSVDALVDTGNDPVDKETEEYNRKIDFNSDVVLVTASPTLEIDTDGTILTQDGITFTDDGSDSDIADGTTLTINKIENKGSLAGEINLLIDADIRDSVSEIVGMPDITFQTGFNEVNIINLADLDVVLKKISVVNDAATAGNLLNFSAGTDRSEFSFTNTTDPGATVITVDTTRDVLITGVIDNTFGSTTILARGGDITSQDASDTIESDFLTLSAAGTIGSASSGPVQTKASTDTGKTTLSADAVSVMLSHTGGDLRVDTIGATGVVEIASTVVRR